MKHSPLRAQSDNNIIETGSFVMKIQIDGNRWSIYYSACKCNWCQLWSLLPTIVFPRNLWSSSSAKPFAFANGEILIISLKSCTQRKVGTFKACMFASKFKRDSWKENKFEFHRKSFLCSMRSSRAHKNDFLLEKIRLRLWLMVNGETIKSIKNFVLRWMMRPGGVTEFYELFLRSFRS